PRETDHLGADRDGDGLRRAEQQPVDGDGRLVDTDARFGAASRADDRGDVEDDRTQGDANDQPVQPSPCWGHGGSVSYRTESGLVTLAVRPEISTCESPGA